MKILSRYVLKEFLANLGLGVMVFTFILLMDRLFELVDLLLRKGVGLWITLKILIFLLPSSLSITLPMSFLLATLLTYGRLSENNEITAARASGLSAWSYVRAPFAAALIAVAILIPFNGTWAPLAHSQFRTIYVDLLQRNPLVRIEEKTFAEVGDYHIYVHKKDRKTNELRGITIYRTSAQGAPLRIFASRGKAYVHPTQGVQLDLADGRIEQIDPNNAGQWFYTGFGTYSLSVPFKQSGSGNDRTLDEMTNRELGARIQELKSKGVPYPIVSCQKHLRWALAMTPLLFLLLATPLALLMHRGGRSLGFALSLGITLIYYVLIMGGSGLGQRGVWPPWLAVWLGNMILAVLGGFMTWRFLRI